MRRRRNSINIRLGKTLRALREERGVSQAEVAKQLQILRTSLVNIEYGRQNLSVAMLVRFSDVYGVEIGTILESCNS